MYARSVDIYLIVFSLHGLSCCRVLAISPEQIHVFAEFIDDAVGAFGFYQHEIDTVFHILAARGAVPAFFWISPIIELLSPSVEDIGVELRQTLVFLGLEDIVDAIAIG